MRKLPNGHAWSLIPVLVLATACGDVLDNVPPRPAAIEDPAVADAAFPSLATVPARPQLTYSLEQRREIAEGLVADRANARYAGDTLRQALDRPVQPDTAAALPPVVQASPSASDPEGDLSLAFLEETLARDSDDGSLGDFLDRLQQPPPEVAEIRPSLSERPTDADMTGPSSDRPADGPAATTAPAAAAPAPDAPLADASPLFPLPEQESLAPEPDGPAVEITAVAPSEPSPADPIAAPPSPALVDQPVAAPVEAPPAGPSLPLSILFQADALDLVGQEYDKLRSLARDFAGGDTTIVVSGGGERAGLAMERARRVAAALVEGGLLPGRIAIEMGGESNVVVVYEADA